MTNILLLLLVLGVGSIVVLRLAKTVTTDDSRSRSSAFHSDQAGRPGHDSMREQDRRFEVREVKSRDRPNDVTSRANGRRSIPLWLVAFSVFQVSRPRRRLGATSDAVLVWRRRSKARSFQRLRGSRAPVYHRLIQPDVGVHLHGASPSSTGSAAGGTKHR